MIFSPLWKNSLRERIKRWSSAMCDTPYTSNQPTGDVAGSLARKIRAPSGNAMHFASVTSIIVVHRAVPLSVPTRPRLPPLPPRAAARYYRYIVSEAVWLHEKVWPIAARRAIGPRAIGSTTAGVERDRRRHVALSLRTRQSSARARRALARPSARERREGGGGALRV